MKLRMVSSICRGLVWARQRTPRVLLLTMTGMQTGSLKVGHVRELAEKHRGGRSFHALGHHGLIIAENPTRKAAAHWQNHRSPSVSNRRVDSHSTQYVSPGMSTEAKAQ